VLDRTAYADDDALIAKAAHAQTAQGIEESAITLLENRRHTLPLGAPKTIAVIGEPATTFTTGGGSGNVKPFAFHDPLTAIRARAKGSNVVYDDGSDPARAAAAAKALTSRSSSRPTTRARGADRSCLTLECPTVHGDQDGLIERVAAAQPNTVVVLETGGPVLTPWRARVAALVEAWYPGQEGGPAIARVLFGDADPGGRLPATFPKSESDLPTAGDPEAYPGRGGDGCLQGRAARRLPVLRREGQDARLPVRLRALVHPIQVLQADAAPPRRRGPCRAHRPQRRSADGVGGPAGLTWGCPRRPGEPPRQLKALRSCASAGARQAGSISRLAGVPLRTGRTAGR